MLACAPVHVSHFLTLAPQKPHRRTQIVIALRALNRIRFVRDETALLVECLRKYVLVSKSSDMPWNVTDKTDKSPPAGVGCLSNTLGPY